METQLDNDIGSETVTLTESEVKEIVENKFNGVSSSVTVSLKKDNGLYVYEADFKSNEFYGTRISIRKQERFWKSTVKYGTAVNHSDRGSGKRNLFVFGGGGQVPSYEEVEQLVIEKAGGGFVKDIDLEKERGKYVYEVELIKDNVEYDYIVDAETGEVTLENEHASYFDYDGDYKSGTSGEGSGNGSSNSIPTAPQTLAKDGSSSSTGGSSSSNGSSNLIPMAMEIPAATGSLRKRRNPSFLPRSREQPSSSLSWREGRQALRLRGRSHSGRLQYEFEIDANSGVIIDWEKGMVRRVGRLME